jgi:hypothetical protein
MKRKEVEIERVEAINEIINPRKLATKLFRDTHIRGEILHNILYQEGELIIELAYGLDKADDFIDAHRKLITKEKYLWCADVLEELAKVFREKGLDK